MNTSVSHSHMCVISKRTCSSLSLQLNMDMVVEGGEVYTDSPLVLCLLYSSVCNFVNVF